MACSQYALVIEELFFSHYKEGVQEIEFDRFEFSQIAKELGIAQPKKLRDVIYPFRYPTRVPDIIRAEAPDGLQWMIEPVSQTCYRFVLVTQAAIRPSELLSETKIPDATPAIIDQYALTDEQALLAKLRYNRLIDLFTGLTCYSLQSHLRTYVPDLGQVETGEVYIGLDRCGTHYVLPVLARDGTTKVDIVQIERNIALCQHRFPSLLCRPVAAQLMSDELIALFELERTDRGIVITVEKHYRLIWPKKLSLEELARYQVCSL